MLDNKMMSYVISPLVTDKQIAYVLHLLIKYFIIMQFILLLRVSGNLVRILVYL